MLRKIGYDYLREMCASKCDFSSLTPQINPLTNRVRYIMYQLEQLNINYELDYFDSENPNTLHIGKPKFVNVVVRFRGKSNDSVIFLAHHDILRTEFENCNDNTASVCNLLDLASRIKGKELERNVVIVWTDAEERVMPEKSGAKRLALRINNGDFANVLFALNLELTGNGSCIWASCGNDNSELLKKLNIQRVRSPINDAVTLERNGIDSVCIGTLTEGELNSVIETGYCSTWSLCHKQIDKFELASEKDMTAFVYFLETLL